MKLLVWVLLLAAGCAATAQSQRFTGGPSLDAQIEAAIKEGRLPGAVVLVGHEGRVVYRKAYGDRSVEPTTEPMTADTIFDLASLTKVIATTSSLMKLYEEGRFRLNDKITQYIPEFQGGKSDITIRNLMTHFSGLQPDFPLEPQWKGYDEGIRRACSFPPAGPPGVSNVYSDINFILLGELVHRLSGKMLSDYSKETIFAPLGMRDTMFLPPASLIPRIAPTERGPDGVPFRGVVHDPRARNMDGVAGHAGLFSTVDDLARFAQMMLNGGQLGRVRLFSPLTVEKFTEPQTPTDQPILRGLGWDIDSAYSSNRGELFPVGSYGHTGFTGTSIWIDPMTKTYVILLANAVHPTMRPSIVGLRSRVATVVAASYGLTARRVVVTGYNETATNLGRRRKMEHQGGTLTGLDVWESEKFAALAGKRVGLITNPSGLDRDGKRNLDLMRAAGVNVVALFSPEHGWASAVDRPGIQDTVDPATGIKVYSLYGATLRPTAEMLKGLDALVFDIQDVGVRFYTYGVTMAYCLEAAAKAGVPYYILDRPNPITGVTVEGPPLDAGNTSFVGYFAGIPVRYGMTLGELAAMYNEEKHLGAKLTVVQMKNWDRGDWFDSTNLTWLNPSPNMRSLNAASLYPGLCLMESLRNFSVGRGTDSPFEQVGADFVNGRELAAYLNRRHIPGVAAYPTSFTPSESKFAGANIQGVRFVITDRDALDPTRLGLELAVAIQRLYPGKVDFSGTKHLIGSDDVIRQIEAGEDPEDIMDSYRDATEAFKKIREKYLLYH
jgi:uncharacterized protein YbbC (DUF1343 family)/CubicO group peptidase (beta-lactamase class C family)